MKVFNGNLRIGMLQGIPCLLLSVFVFWWYLFLNRHLCLFYREQSQMFLFSHEYFLQYVEQPGGLTAYAASFLTQFFYFPVVGTGIYLLLFWGLYRIFKQVLDEFSIFGNSFIVAFIPGILFLPASVCLQFDVADELAVVFALAGFIVLTRFSRNKYYYLLLPVTISAVYALVGGNIVLSLTLFLLYSFFKRQRGYWKQILTVFLSLLIPFALWYFFYPVSFREACTALTPFRYQDLLRFDFRVMAGLSVVIIPVIGRMLKNVKTKRQWIMSYNIGLGVIILAAILKLYNPNILYIAKMGFDTENNNWENILDTSKKMTVSPLRCFYTNLALQKTGQLSEKMFHYDQIGTSGLIIDLEDFISCQAKGELFYRLGLLNIARYYAFESMIGYAIIKEPNIRNVTRLLECAVVGRDSTLAAKYGKILDKTLFYRNYAGRLDEKSTNLHPVKMRNMFTRDMSAVLVSMLEDNPDNQAVFEYVMAYYMLEREYGKAKDCYDRYYSNFPYSQIPTHYAELLVLYKHLNRLDDRFYEHYPVSRDVRERFDMMDVLVASQMDKQIQKTLEDRFMDTYWFYVKFPLVNIQTMKQDEKNIY